MGYSSTVVNGRRTNVSIRCVFTTTTVCGAWSLVDTVLQGAQFSLFLSFFCCFSFSYSFLVFFFSLFHVFVIKRRVCARAQILIKYPLDCLSSFFFLLYLLIDMD